MDQSNFCKLLGLICASVCFVGLAWFGRGSLSPNGVPFKPTAWLGSASMPLNESHVKQKCAQQAELNKGPEKLLDETINRGHSSEKITHVEFNETALMDTPTNNHSSHYENKIIIFWTDYYGKEPLSAHGRKEGSSAFIGCPKNQCILTANKSRLDDASMLIFHHMDNPNFPEVRYPKQLYVHYTMDPPQRNSSYLDQFEDKINLTVNYRMDADVPNPYIKYQKHSKDFTRVYKPLTSYLNKTKSVVWMVSHCITESQREQYVKELQKYIDVDIIGYCGNHTCPKEQGYFHCMKQFEKTYKFYLSFENNICPFYKSEKLSNALDVELVPVVLGMPNYTHDSSVAPSHSVINVKDFASPKHLAEYLLFLSHNENEYNRYFEWKTQFHKQYVPFMCTLCDVLHSDKYLRGEQILPSYKKYGGYRHWWRDGCDNGLMARMREHGGW